MTDIVTRLRDPGFWTNDGKVMLEAADEIERLRKRGRNACVCHWDGDFDEVVSGCAAHEHWRDQAVAAETERCAKVAEAHDSLYLDTCNEIAQAIRNPEYIICCDNQRLVDVPTIVDAIIGNVRCHACNTAYEIDEKYRRALLESLFPEIQTA